MKLPVLLAGPIIRRVDKNEITIWIATSGPYNVSAELYKISDASERDDFQYDSISTISATTTIQMGKKLFIQLIKISPKAKYFPTQALLGYNLFFSNQFQSFDLSTLGLLSSDSVNSIVYGQLNYPTFFINETSKSTFLYGSCRKPHGKGHDALAKGDETIADTYLNLAKRPCSLFMIGDQIYADDVAEPLAPYIFELGKELIGKKDPALLKLDKRLSKEPYRSNLYKVNGRSTIMSELCQFTSRNSDNHLITFGEYAAMYLLSWSPEIWELNEFEETLNRENSKKDSNVEGDNPILKWDKDQIKRVKNFFHTLPQIRRLLANIPTYMIFDDHDITDDWNISLEWKNAVSKAPLGRHVITNGLAAYWAFQAWGNDSSVFTEKFLNTMQNQFSPLKYQKEDYHKWAQQLWDFQSWSFIAPTTPKTVFLDTRTQRAYSTGNSQDSIRKKLTQAVEGPEIISKKGWKQVTKRLKTSGWETGTPLIIVSPVPFYGVDLIETFVHEYVAPLKIIGLPVKTIFDMEAWKYNGKGFTQFLRTISQWNPSTCILLSGDAHMASSAMAVIEEETGRKRSIVQFTSSPLHNPSLPGIPGLLLKGATLLFEKESNHRRIYRCCYSDFSLTQSTNPSSLSGKKAIWSESITYLPLQYEQLIKTKNNIGLMRLHNKIEITNHFLS